jgi:uncharacterized protein YegL
MKAYKILLLFVIIAAFSTAEARARRRRRNKGKLSYAACARRCNRKSGGCKKPPPKEACEEKAVDLIMVLDGSSSVGPKNFTIVKKFMSNIVNKFSVKPDGVRVALHQYSSGHKQQLEFNLGRHSTKAAVLDAIDNIEWLTGDTYTAKALEQVRTKIIEPAHKADPTRARMVLVITDGDPQDFKKVPASVNALKPLGVKIFAIGVGDATTPELKKIAWTGEK